MKQLMFKIGSRILVIVCMIIVFLFFVLKKKKFGASLSEKEDFVLKIIAGIVIVFMILKMALPVVLDIPYYVKGEFQMVTGYARDNAHGKGNDRSVVIIDEDSGKEMYVEFSYSKGIDKGDYLTVKYLPYSKCGILLKKNNVIISEE